MVMKQQFRDTLIATEKGRALELYQKE